MGKDEAELIAKCKKGDIKSYELLYNRYSAAMYHTCMRIVSHAVDAEDILQDAFMDAFINLHRIKNTDAFAGWLKRIVINKAINHIKRNKRNWLELEETNLINQADEEKIDEFEFQWKVELVREALNLLPENARMVINLHVFEKMSFEEIAGLMEVPSSTIRSQYLRGRQKILNRVGNASPQPSPRERGF